MGVPIRLPNDAYRVATMGMDDPATEITPEHWYSGLASSVPTGIAAGGAAVARTFNDALHSMPTGGLAFAPGGAAVEAIQSFNWNRDQAARSAGQKPKSEVADAIKAVKDWSQQDPRVTSELARVAHGTTRGLTIALSGSLLGGPEAGAMLLASTEGYNDFQDSLDAGVDPRTALKKAALTGTAAGLGMLLPMKVSGRSAMRLAGLGLEAEVAGNTALARVLYGAAEKTAFMSTNVVARYGSAAGVNTGFGVASRYLTSDLLASAGYKDMAEQYKALDGRAIAADVVLGLAFGGVQHLSERAQAGGKAPHATERPTADMIQDALEIRREEMISRGAGGLPTDVRTAGIDHLLQEQALSDTLQGKPVDVSPERAQALVDGSITDPERVHMYDSWTEAGRHILGDLADFTESPKLEKGVTDGSLVARTGSGVQARVPEGYTPGISPVEAPGNRQAAGRAEGPSNAARAGAGILNALADDAAPLRAALDRIAPASEEAIHTTVKARGGAEHTLVAEFSKSDIHVSGEPGPKGARPEAWVTVLPNGDVAIRGYSNGDIPGMGFQVKRMALEAAQERYGVKDTARVYGDVSLEGAKALERVKGVELFKAEDGRNVSVTKLADALGKEASPVVPKAEAAIKLDPMVSEHVRQLAEAHPDLDVQMPDGRTVKAADIESAMAESLAKADKESSLFEVAVGCFLRMQA